MRPPQHISKNCHMRIHKSPPPPTSPPLSPHNLINKALYLMLGPIFYQTTHVVRK